MREIMAQKEIDLLLILDTPQDAFDQWLTGQRLLGQIIVPKDDEITGFFLAKYTPADSILLLGDTPDFRRYLVRQPCQLRRTAFTFVIARIPSTLKNSFCTMRLIRRTCFTLKH